jgi:hypothetical protein
LICFFNAFFFYHISNRKNQHEGQDDQTNPIKQTALGVEQARRSQDATRKDDVASMELIEENTIEESGENDEEWSDSYFLLFVDCIRVVISDAQNEQEARQMIIHLLSKEFPKYFNNDLVINRLLDLSHNVSDVLHKNDLNVMGNENDEDEHPILQEDVRSSQEHHAYVGNINDEELVSMISDILLCSKASDGDTPFSPLEEANAKSLNPTKESNSFLANTPLSPAEEVSGKQEFEESNHDVVEELKLDDTNQDDSLQVISANSSLDRLHVLSEKDADEDSVSRVDPSDLSYSFCNGEFDANLSWPSLPEEDKPHTAADDKPDQDMHVSVTVPQSITVPQFTFSEPTCIVTTSSCRSCKADKMHEDSEPKRSEIPDSKIEEKKHDYKSSEPSTSGYTKNSQDNEFSEHVSDVERILKRRPTHGLPTAPLSLSSLGGSFSDVLSRLTPGKWSLKKGRPGAVRELWSSSSQTNNSFNTSFSISSLEDMLSPGIPPRPSSRLFDSPEKSPQVLGIRLHKPTGIKDVFLSVVDHDKETGQLCNITDTWTLGTREEMDLILYVDTNPVLPATKKYSGRYSLVFNDKSDLDDFLSQDNSQESFGFSMLCSHENDFDSKEDQEISRDFSSAAEDEPELQSTCDFEDTLYSTDSEEEQEEEYYMGHEDGYQKSLPENPKLLDFSHIEWMDDEDSGKVFLVACLALTGYFMYRYLR